MKHDQFIGKVQARARVDSRGEAEKTTRVVLEAFRDRLAGGEPEDLAAQLPEEIDRYLLGGGAGERIKLSEFYDRVAEGLGVDRAEAAHRARAVISVLAEAVTPGELDDVRAQLPDEWQSLFDAPESRIGRSTPAAEPGQLRPDA
jgi:uncharacterized protein (DUF2267 family)